MKKTIIKKLVLSLLISFISISLISCGTRTVQTDTAQENQIVNTPVTTTSQTDQKSSHIQNQDPQDPNTAEITPADSSKDKDIIINNAHKKRVKAKGLYLTATSAGVRLQHYIDLANTTEINSYVIDVKNDYGNVCYDSSVPLAKEIGAIDVRYDIDKVIKELHDNDIYAIARIVSFKDPVLAKSNPEFAIKNKDGELYVHNKMNWVNPYNKQAWQYNIDLAKEALAKGFDEVQFDYVRFPDGRKSEMVFGDTHGKKMYETINEYLAYARQEMPDAILSADVFAIIAESPGDTEGIGQYFEHIGKNMDYIYLMAYPSHYALGQIINNVKFPKPDLDPYGVIKNTLLRAKERSSKVDGHTPVVRTYLQDFTASWIGQGNYQKYEDKQIRQQIQAVYDAGYEEWILWDHMNSYREGAFEKN
ncbi:putative glycoside hydrolase [Petroclostridium sp. X23]|uniref:putative glycoside hydrolase n=1 Tax=Petroclostridium sp. X23 TaxID=3045146 RepID=UPI0024ADE559|nr:putative glycoside hydrolase [Petroclostridium sp. X23]WHH58661.1 putative glycoside hydrolase [Petroclostridium sp. X23]